MRERILYSIRSLTFSQWRFESRIGMRGLGSFNNCMSERVLDVFKAKIMTLMMMFDLKSLACR